MNKQTPMKLHWEHHENKHPRTNKWIEANWKVPCERNLDPLAKPHKYLRYNLKRNRSRMVRLRFCADNEKKLVHYDALSSIFEENEQYV